MQVAGRDVNICLKNIREAPKDKSPGNDVDGLSMSCMSMHYLYLFKSKYVWGTIKNMLDIKVLRIYAVSAWILYIEARVCFSKTYWESQTVDKTATSTENIKMLETLEPFKLSLNIFNENTKIKIINCHYYFCGIVY